MRQVVEKRAHLVADARYKVRQAAQRLARLSHISTLKASCASSARSISL